MSRRTPEQLRVKLGAKMAAKLAAVRARAQKPRKKPPEKRRRRWWPWLLLLLLLLLLLRLCSCAEEPVPPPPEPIPAGPVEVGEPTPPEPPPRPPARVGRIPRGKYANPAPDVLPWVTQLRMQVAARSPRLAACFEGIARPGALKWTAAVEPGSGEVSDHTLEATTGSDALTAEQRACVLGVLSDPPYKLEAGAERSTPPRVSIAIEF